MKNYLIKPGIRGMFSVELDPVKLDVIDSTPSHIDWMYIAPDDGKIVLPSGEETEVKKDDIVVVFYNSPYTKNSVVVVDNNKWKENIELEREYKTRQEPNTESCRYCETCDCYKESAN